MGAKLPVRPWLVSGFFTAFFIGIAAGALQFSPSARLMPLAIAAPGALLSLLQLATDLRLQAAPGDAPSAEFSRSTAGMLLWLVMLVAASISLGLLVGCWLFITAFLVRARYRVVVSILTATLFSTLAYLIFTVILGVSLHQGLLTAVLLP